MEETGQVQEGEHELWFNIGLPVGVRAIGCSIETSEGDRAFTIQRETIGSDQFTLTPSVTPAGAGSIALSPVGGVYDEGTEVEVTATANSGYTFSGWLVNNTPGTFNPGTVTMDGDVQLVAVFTPNVVSQYTLTTGVTPAGAGTAFGGGNYNPGATATASASANSGWHFDHWTGDLSGSANPTTVVMNANKSVTAVFVQDTPPIENAAEVAFTRNGSPGTMRINPGNFSLRSITADESAAFLPVGATFADIDQLGVEIVNIQSPYWYIMEYSAGTMAPNTWSTSIPLDGYGFDSNGVAKHVDIVNWVGGRAIPFYTLRTAPGIIFSLNTGMNKGTLDGQVMTVDVVGFKWPANK